jgi:hypothetical protein
MARLGQAAKFRTAIAWAVLSSAVARPALAGPPYVTDDPEPVPYRHWEFYLGSQLERSGDELQGWAPHVEANYGAVPDLQLHVIVPLAVSHVYGGRTAYGPGDIELGFKYRFVDEGDWVPMIGTFPMFEVPSGSEPKGLGTGHAHGFVPLWIQKSAGPYTSYGGGGYWVNPGPGNRDYWYVGWQIQRRVLQGWTPGVELFYTTPDQIGGRSNFRFNLGSVVDFTENHHWLFSAGRSIFGDTLWQGYLAYQLTV